MTKRQLETFANAILNFYIPENKQMAEFDLKHDEYHYKLQEIYNQIMLVSSNVDKTIKDEVVSDTQQKFIAVYATYM